MKFWGWVGTALLMAVLVACTRPPQAAHPIMESEAPFGKLPPRARPLAYDVALKVDPREESFRGIVKIDVWLNEPSDGIWLHGKDLRVNAASINGRTATWEEVLNSTGVSRIVFPRTFPAGEVTLAIAYEADFNMNLAGLFRVEEEGEAYALAKSESIQARRFLPSFDEPGLKAPFEIALVVPEGYQAISNTPEISRRPARDDEGFEEVRFDTTRPLSTYLLSVAVGPFDVVEAEDIPPNDIRSEPIPLRGFAGKGRGDQLARALETTGPLVEIFETALDQPYPYQKLDIIAAPAWPSGATELAGAITYREERLLLDENSGPAADRAMLNIHTHELAHMWFGNLVTPPWWDDLWLKEAYATWGTPLALIEYEPDAGHEVDAVMRAISAMRLDSLSSTRAVREPIGRNENIRNAYDAITYSKGMAVIAMADAYFGAGVFRPALGRYIAEFADKDAGSPDFYKVIGDVTGEPSMTAVFESFVEQKGVPLLSTNVTCEEAETIEPAVTLSQARYRPLGSAIELGTQWTVPVCVAFDNGTDRPGRACGMMRDETLTVSLGSQAACPAWVWPNADGAGYFRIALSEADWAAIVDHFDQLSATEALSAVDSAVAAFEAGEGNARDILSVLEAASRHSDRRVAIAPTQPIRRLSSLLAEGEARTALRDEVTRWYLPRFDGLAGDDGADATVLRRDLEAFLAIDLEEAGVREALLVNASS
ncbi:MAG: M1 family metallopeptidase, partial [Pseudomonadota bacterium]